MINITLIDDNVATRSLCAQHLSLEHDIKIVGECAPATENWRNTFTTSKDVTDIAVVAIARPDENGLGLLNQLHQQQPQLSTIILSHYDTAAFVYNTLNTGARGYLARNCKPEELLQSIRTVNVGGLYLCTNALQVLCNARRDSAKLRILTRREKEIFQQLISGLTVKTIAENFSLSHKTIHVHRANVLKKLNCNNTVELIHFALRHQLLTSSHQSLDQKII